MRLICPNCGAQYDVPTEVIPKGGRDVQCSSCGHTWYQHHPDNDTGLADELGHPLPDPEWTPEDEIEDTPPPPPPAPAPRPRPVPRRPLPQSAPPRQAPEPEQAPTEPTPPQTAPEPQPEPHPETAGDVMAKPRPLDPEVADLFRQERDFEARQRAAETLESQPELGLQAPEREHHTRRARQSHQPMSRLRGDVPTARRQETPDLTAMDATSLAGITRPTGAAPRAEDYAPDEGQAIADTAVAAAAAASSRRDLLPDVDEINQTLRSTAEPRGTDTADRDQTRAETDNGGFGKGFVSVVLLTVLAIATYAMAPRLSEALPQTAPALQTYVAWVDAARTWLDGQVTALMHSLDSMSTESAQPLPEEPEPATPEPATPVPPSPDAAAPDPAAPDPAARQD